MKIARQMKEITDFGVTTTTRAEENKMKEETRNEEKFWKICIL
jgi:hypothetical protein